MAAKTDTTGPWAPGENGTRGVRHWHVRRSAIDAGVMMNGAGRVMFVTIVRIKRGTHRVHGERDTYQEAGMQKSRVSELLYQALETEIGGAKVYKAALRCAQNEQLKKEWGEYMEQTTNHERIVREVCERLGLDPDLETDGRKIVRHKWQALVGAMEMAQKSGPPETAQLVAAECVVEAETKDHLNWELIAEAAEKLTGEDARTLRKAHAEVEEEEDEHLYHTTGWTRELWIKSLGLPAVLPPPEETKDVKTAIGAARAKQARNGMLKK